MDEQHRAEEHLRIIRSLMERATIYRAISAPVALVGGVTSLAVAAWMLWRSGFIGSADRPEPMTARDFIAAWLLPLVVTASANTLFIWREARLSQRQFLSPGLRLALRSLIPPMLVAGAMTFIAWRNPTDLEGPVIVALTWISCYGLALLATMNFAPRSLCVLGWSFAITAVMWLLVISAPTVPTVDFLHGQTGGNIAMALTFGVYHLIYAGSTWSRASTAKTQPV